MKVVASRHALDMTHVEFHDPVGAIGGKNRRALPRHIGPHSSQLTPSGRNAEGLRRAPLQGHLAADLACVEMASIASEFHRATVHDREIVAELAGKVEI